MGRMHDLATFPNLVDLEPANNWPPYFGSKHCWRETALCLLNHVKQGGREEDSIKSSFGDFKKKR